MGPQQKCLCAGLLHRVLVHSSELLGFHALGSVPAQHFSASKFAALLLLRLKVTRTFSSNYDYYIPDGITFLTFLADVNVDVHHSSLQASYCLFVLTNKTSLCFVSISQASLTIPDGLTKLQQLQRSAVAGLDCVDFLICTSQINRDLMPHLRQVEFACHGHCR